MGLGFFGEASFGNIPQRLVLSSGRKEKIVSNKTHSFLLVTEKDIGDLLMLKFKWEETNGWSTSSMLKMVSSWWSGDSDGANMEVHKIRIRAGETQQKYVVSRLRRGDGHQETHRFKVAQLIYQLIFDRMVFCVKDPDVQSLTQELTFVRCKDAWRTNKRNPKR